MNILIAGGNHIIDFLIKSLLSNGHEVMLINQDYERCKSLADKYEIEAICGNGSEVESLKSAHVDKMDAVIALTEQDATNLVICELAKNQFNVKYTFTIVNDPRNEDIFQSFGISKCVNITRILDDLIEQNSIEENIISHLPLKDKKVVVYDMVLSHDAPSINKKLWELGFPSQSMLACIIREKDVIIPQGNTVLMAGDKVVVITSPSSSEATYSLLNGKR
ncbi:MAG: potassium channel family protein [Saccharofermentanales bacterium]